MTTLLNRTLCEKYALTAAACGLTAGIIGPSNMGYYSAGIAMGLWLAAWGVWIND